MYCQLFLHHYAEEGTEYRVSLNDEGFDEIKTVATAKTVLDAWKDLIVHMDKIILKDKRTKDPARAAQWILRYTVQDTGRASGSLVSQISRVTTLIFLQHPGFFLSKVLSLKLTACLVNYRRISALAGAIPHLDV